MKISKYFDFVSESFELILESDVVYSDKLRKVLHKMDNELSNKLLEIENKDFPVRDNFFDITDTNDTISFIQYRRAQTILGDRSQEIVSFEGDSGGWLTHNLKENGAIFDMLGYKPVDGSHPYEPSNEEKGKVIKKVVSPTSGNTYVWVKFENGEGVYNQRILKTEDGRNEVWSKNRQTIRIGRGIRSIISAAKMQATDKEIEDFVNQYKATFDNINDVFFHFEEVKGNDIAHWYSYKNYERGRERGTIGSSCMADVNSNYFEIYTSNPDKISLIIYKSPNDSTKIRGRALLWKLNDGKIYMDRVYTQEDSDANLFSQYCVKNKWYKKYRNDNSASGGSLSPTGDHITIDLVVNLEKVNYDRYPYLDTLKYYNPTTGVIANESFSGCLTLEDTDGGHNSCDLCDGEGRMECEECNGNGRETCSNGCDDGRLECSSCDGGGENDCDSCDGSGEVDDTECESCKGEGTIDCENCDGKGDFTCDECGGDGDQECSNCDGDGMVDCNECN